MRKPVEVTTATLREWPLPTPGSEKRARGVVLVVAGSASTPGAARLSGEAALRVGAGQLKLATAASTATALGVAVPEARVYALAEATSGDPAVETASGVAEIAEQADAVLVGPGFVEPSQVAAFLHELVGWLRVPLVLDALASEYVERHTQQLAGYPAARILNMNNTELGHALGIPTDQVERAPTEAVARLVDATEAVVVLGGEATTIGSPDGSSYLVTAGGPGLAVSGSGDVQAGLVTGLLARGATPDQAAIWGAWLHACAGERLAAAQGPLGFLARDLAAEVPALLAELGQEPA